MEFFCRKPLLYTLDSSAHALGHLVIQFVAARAKIVVYVLIKLSKVKSHNVARSRYMKYML